jgi:hypothetical protein
MPGPESGPGGPQGKPFKEREKQKDPYDLNKLLNPDPTRGGELVPTSGSSPASTGESHPHQNGYSGDISGRLNPSSASSELAGGASGGSHGGGVATLERPATQTQTQTETGAPLVPPPPEVGIAIPEAQTGVDPLRVVLTSLDQNVDAFAREAAHEKLSKKHEGGFWKRIAKSAWHNITREYQVVKETDKARQEILENNNLLHHQGKSDEQWREATKMRYSSEFGEHLMHEGETFHKLNSPEAPKDPKAERITADVQDLHRRVAKGEFADDDSLRMEIDRMTQAWNAEKISQDYIGEGQFLATNLAESCRELEGMINSAEGLSALDKEALLEARLSTMQVIAGEARVGSRTEIDSTLSERVAEKLKGVPFLNEGRLARITSALGNETVVAAMMSAGIYAAKRGASLAGKIVAPGIGAGIVAAIRERNALMDERALEERRADADKEEPELPDDSELSGFRKVLKKVGVGKTTEEYRAEVAATRYEARPVGELITELNGLYNESGELNITDRAGLEQAMNLMGQIRTRIRLGDRTGARLINFADVSAEEMESRRFDLDLAMAKLETDMKKMMENPVAQAMLDIPPEESFDEFYNAQCEIAEGMLMGEMKAKDRLFKKLVIKRAFKRALAATFAGAAVGAGVKYGAEIVREAINSVRETFTDLFNGAELTPEMALAGYETDLDGNPIDHVGTGDTVPTDHIGTGGNLPTDHVGTGGNLPNDHVGTATNAPTDHVGTGNGTTSTAPTDHVGTGTQAPADHVGTGGNHIPGDHVGAPETDSGGMESTQISDTSKLNLPEGYKAETSNGEVTLTGPGGEKIPGLTLDKDGSLSQQAQELLKSKGFTINDHVEVVQGKPDISQSSVTPSEFVQNHRDDMKLIHHTKWFDNNTSKYDLNELGLQNNMDSSGNIVISIKGMTAGGSFHGASGVNWQEAAKDGHLKVYLSASRGTQAHAFEIQIKPDGTAVIDKNSPADALFNENGKFIGGFQEVALNGGKAADGGENIATLATVVGNHSPKITDTIKTPTFHSAHSYTVTAPVQPTSFTSPLPPVNGPAPVIPITGRRRIGQPQTKPTPTAPVEAPLAPVIPIRPELTAAPTPAAPEAPGIAAAPAAARTPESEQRAQTMGLPSSEQAQTPPDVDNGAETDDQEESQDHDRDAVFNPEERPFIDQIEAESRPFPLMESGIDMKSLTSRQRKFLTVLAYEAMRQFPRGAGENDFGYDRRIKREMAKAGVVGMQKLGASRGAVSRSFLALSGRVFGVMQQLRTPSSRGGTGGSGQAAA